MKLKKIFGGIMLCAITIVPAFSFADVDTANASGGWTETGGYYSSNASSSPESHKGRRITGVESNVTYYQVEGTTVWKDVLHTTTARLETTSGSVLKSDVDRAVGGTYALTDKHFPSIGQNTEARTYWKKG